VEIKETDRDCIILHRSGICIFIREAGREAIWLQNLYGELGFPQEFLIGIQGDNEGSVILTHNPQFHQ
jgi:hypothetical protein